MSTPIFDQLLAEASPDRRAVVLIGLATAELHADHAWAEFDAAMKES